MKKLMKAAALIMIVALAVSCQAEPEYDFGPEIEATSAEDFIYSEKGGNITITGYKGEDLRVVIPRSIGGKTVTAIGERAFENNKTIVSLSIPYTVTSIGEGATHGCSGIEELKVVNSATRGIKNPVYISDGNCIIRIEGMELVIGCKNSVMPDTVVEVGSWAFREVEGLEKIIIGEGVTKIHDFAFLGCKDLREVHIGRSVNDIGYGILDGCTDVEKITVSPLNRTFDSKDNCIMTEDGTKIVAGCRTSVIPDGTLVIGEGCFQGQRGFTEMNIPESVTTIERGAFYGTAIEKIAIPKNVALIENSAFGYCREVKDIKVSEGNEKFFISEKCLIENREYGHEEPKTVRATLIQAFPGCYKVDGTKVKVIGYRAFGGVNLSDHEGEGENAVSSFVIGEGVEEIEREAFRGTNIIGEIKLPDSLRELGPAVFQNCPLARPVYPEALTFTWQIQGFGDEKFYELISYNGTGTDVNVPETHEGLPVKAIRLGAFTQDTIESIHIPACMEDIDEWSIQSLPNLKTITVDEKNTCYRVEDGCLIDIKDDIQMAIAGTVDCKIPEGVKVIELFAFKESSNESFVLPSTLVEIRKYAFDCLFGAREKEMTIEIPESVKIIGKCAFSTNEKYPVKVKVPYSSESELPKGWDKEWFNGDPSHVIYANQK